jgi:flagellar hook-associated protein 3 FlgL
MVNLGNSSYKGEYMFSGTDTDKVPFSVNTGAMNINTVANEVPAGGAAADTTDDAFVLNTPMHIWDRNITDSADSLYGNPSTKRLIPGSVTVSSLVEGTDYRVDYVKGDITFLTPAAQAEATAGTLNIQFDWIRRNELLNTNGDVKREIEPGILMEINIKADGAFGQETDLDSFSAMITLMQGLHTSTQSEIESSITNLDVAMNRMLGQQATVGSRTNRMESTADRNDGNIINSTELLSRIEDLDFAKAISDFTMASTVYQASLKSASKILTPSLMDYM